EHDAVEAEACRRPFANLEDLAAVFGDLPDYDLHVINISASAVERRNEPSLARVAIGHELNEGVSPPDHQLNLFGVVPYSPPDRHSAPDDRKRASYGENQRCAP